MRRASKFGWTVEGIEPGPWGAKAAKRYQLTIYPIMVEDIPKSASIQSKIYDMITMIDVVEHLRDPLLAVRIVSDLLKPRGILVMQFPYSSSVVHWTRKHRWPLILLPGHIHYFSKGSTESLLSQSGLMLIDDITDAHTPILPKARWYPINKVDSTLQKGVNALKLGDLRTIFCQKG